MSREREALEHIEEFMRGLRRAAQMAPMDGYPAYTSDVKALDLLRDMVERHEKLVSSVARLLALIKLEQDDDPETWAESAALVDDVRAAIPEGG